MKKTKGRSSMGRRAVVTADEQDVHTGWRHVLCYMDRAGAAKRAKRRSNRRERRIAKKNIREEL